MQYLCATYHQKISALAVAFFLGIYRYFVIFPTQRRASWLFSRGRLAVAKVQSSNGCCCLLPFALRCVRIFTLCLYLCVCMFARVRVACVCVRIHYSCSCVRLRVPVCMCDCVRAHVHRHFCLCNFYAACAYACMRTQISVLSLQARELALKSHLFFLTTQEVHQAALMNAMYVIEAFCSRWTVQNAFSTCAAVCQRYAD